ncbi:hypothetical protein PR202_gb24155 [Eleusine coracana subsp. coracana]|uniref:Uncharacterized protein n=1 Tax=Eleusine coracana subsp. coracana TaxID=191504 RepID=A0AAV5FI47_ELECO|nr:hypothetical protein PR202_gb24155 [Eleusine coracana subsp. coracana]
MSESDSPSEGGEPKREEQRLEAEGREREREEQRLEAEAAAALGTGSHASQESRRIRWPTSSRYPCASMTPSTTFSEASSSTRRTDLGEPGLQEHGGKGVEREKSR